LCDQGGGFRCKLGSVRCRLRSGLQEYSLQWLSEASGGGRLHRIDPNAELDEHFFTRRKGFATTLCDLKNHKVYDDYAGYTEDRLTIRGDRMSDAEFKQFLEAAFRSCRTAVKPGASLYVCHSSSWQP